MEQKEIIIKITNEWIYFNPKLFISIYQTNIPKDYLTFRSHTDIFWKAEIVSYQNENKSLKVKVIDYNNVDISIFNCQKTKFEIDHLLFEKFDWQKLESLLTYYQEIKLLDVIYNINSNTIPIVNDTQTKKSSFDFSKLPTTIDTEQNIKPIIKTIQEKFWILFKDAQFNLGYVTFRKHIKEIYQEVDFKIKNDHILAEFNNVKYWFAKKLETKRFEVNVNITLTNGQTTEISATSEHIDQITPDLIDNVKYERTFALTKKPRIHAPDKLLFTIDEIFNIIDTDENEGNVFNQSEDDILSCLIEGKNIRNKKQLEYLTSEKQSEKHKLRYTLHPLFGFIFIIESIENIHFVWELLNSHATYIWSINKSEKTFEQQFKRIEFIINTIRVSGREAYKRDYRNNNFESDLFFKVIEHEKITTNRNEGFSNWKHKLNEHLT